MATDTRRQTAGTASTGGGAVAPTPKKGKGKWITTAILFLVVIPIALVALWVTIALNYSYSMGERAGFVQKLSKRGWVCKTWEGEMALANGPNVVPEIFRFTVRDDAVAAEINSSLGRQVKLDYDQHKFLPTSCFGETEYFVKKVQSLSGATSSTPFPGSAPVNGPSAPAPAAVPAPAAGTPVTPAPTTPAPATPAPPAAGPQP
jgi:hypothetical protein